jgi:hypothetical protein
MKIMPAFAVAQQQWRLSSRVPAVSPRQHGDERPVEIPAHVSQQIFVALRRTLIEEPVKNALGNKAPKKASRTTMKLHLSPMI